MKKSILGILLIMTMVLGQLVSVAANPSPGKNFDVTDDSKDDGYKIEIEEDEAYKDNVPEGNKIISPVFNIDKDGDKEGKHRVEFYVPDLSDDMKGPIYAYVTYEDGTVVTLEAVEVDYENNIVVFEFDQVPAKVVLFGKVMDIEAVGQSPKTGVMSTWGIWAVLAVVCAAAAFGFSRKSRA